MKAVKPDNVSMFSSIEKAEIDKFIDSLKECRSIESVMTNASLFFSQNRSFGKVIVECIAESFGYIPENNELDKCSESEMNMICSGIICATHIHRMIKNLERYQFKLGSSVDKQEENLNNPAFK
jgi:hypothetical protein